MKKDILQTLADMAVIRQNLNYILNLNWTNKANVKLAQKELMKFDNDFVSLFLDYCKEEPVEESLVVQTESVIAKVNISNMPIIPPKIVDQLKEESDKKRGRKKVTRIENEEK
jgi:hypothetical protein